MERRYSTKGSGKCSAQPKKRKLKHLQEYYYRKRLKVETIQHKNSDDHEQDNNETVFTETNNVENWNSEQLKVYNEENKPLELIPLQTEHSTETNPKTFQVYGRRVVDVSFFVISLEALDSYSQVCCSFREMFVVCEKRSGLKSCFIFKYRMCNMEIPAKIEEDCQEMELNTGAVCGTMSSGGGHAQLEEMMSAMNVPTMSAKTFHKYHDKECDGWEATALNEMQLAAAEEVHLAVVAGDVDRNGVPVIMVITDGSWFKRTEKKYGALSRVVSAEFCTEKNY